MPRLVLYQPPTEAERAYSDARGREQTWLPHGLLCVAATVDSAAWDISLLDGRLHSDGGLATLHQQLEPGDVLSASVMTGHAIRWALKASAAAKEAGATTLWGGPHPTIFPNETLAHPAVDVVVAGGRGEEGFKKWCEGRQAGNTECQYPGVGTKDSTGQGKFFAPFSARNLPARDTLPSPRLDLVTDFGPYLLDDPAIAKSTINHVTSLGCPFACTFCSEPVLSQRKWHSWSAARSVAEVQSLVSMSGANGVKLHDALFFVDMKRALAFAEGIQDFGIAWAATMHPSTLERITQEELRRLRKSGLTRLMMGLESGSQAVVDAIGKNYSVESIPDMAIKLREADIVGMFSCVVGFPNAPSSEYSETIEAAHRIHDIWSRHQIKIHYASPWPGTELWTHALNVPGFSPPTTLEGWSEYDYYLAKMPFHDVSWEAAIEDINRRYCPYYHA